MVDLVLDWLFEPRDLRIIDLGADINRERGLVWFQPRQLLQLDFYIGSLLVWMCWKRDEDEFRVAFGDVPQPWSECEWLSREVAFALVEMKVREHVRNIS